MKPYRRYPLTLPFLCGVYNVPKPEAEYRFAPPRRWRFDFAWPEHKLAVEVDGGAFIGGRHTRGVGFLKDMEKLNAAAELGWRVLRFTPDQVSNGMAVEQVARILGVGATGAKEE